MRIEDIAEAARDHWSHLDWSMERSEYDPDGVVRALLTQESCVEVELTTNRHGRQYIRAGVYDRSTRRHRRRLGHEEPRRAGHPSAVRVLLDDLQEGLTHQKIGFERELVRLEASLAAPKGGER